MLDDGEATEGDRERTAFTDQPKLGGWSHEAGGAGLGPETLPETVTSGRACLRNAAAW